ncbi:hypothetical protein PP182_18710 [Maribacter sp. PR1]|uniref:DUF6544 family protein n=1 Tax=Maribacter cobaltidurans TaxID=1178778 RepID=A0ABU7IYQ7_9FLAO|nr:MULTISPECIES: DUF6544 family protein [Maribacter]MDC6390725.1 hypothetical protein [Maribacter sp. PR1]MEE1978117.1 DUF6544 family protein [Maribacter cobaltidurans]
MRIALIVLMGIHGIIHLFGFLKAFGFSEFNAISSPISKTSGAIWLLTAFLFGITVFLLILQSYYWWISGFLAVIISQFLIFNYWSDAKFGTIANLIILAAVVIAFATIGFQKKVTQEQIALFEASRLGGKVVTEASIDGLPAIVQKWLIHSGVVGKKPISNVHVVQELQLKLKRDQKTWNDGSAEQYFTVHPPAFVWNINTEMNSALSVVGRDKFVNGQGAMTIKLLSLITVANANKSEKVNQATLQRFLAEMVWFPTASLSNYITWEPVDENSAKATMEVNGTKGHGIFHFDDTGNFLKFTANRYKDEKDEAPTLWTVSALKTEEINGIKIPVELQADWQLDDGKWTWLKLTIKEIDYNLNKFPRDGKGHD